MDQARERLIASGALKPERTSTSKLPESIPDDRNKIIREADAVLRDLFPRIPNTDRAEILRHSFDKVCSASFAHGKKMVLMFCPLG